MRPSIARRSCSRSSWFDGDRAAMSVVLTRCRNARAAATASLTACRE
jgi:hypothetical protein